MASSAGAPSVGRKGGWARGGAAGPRGGRGSAKLAAGAQSEERDGAEGQARGELAERQRAAPGHRGCQEQLTAVGH